MTSARPPSSCLGLTFVPVGFEEIAAAYKEADRDGGQGMSPIAGWRTAQEVVEPPRDEIEKSAAMYVAMKALMNKHGARGISINCLGGFYGGHMEAYPCLGFSQLNNDGLVGGCEADQMSALTMATMGALTGRPGYISDPVIDTSKNQIIYAHCVAMTKPFGPDGASNPFRIRTHSEDRKGASIQSLLPAGYMTTTLEINPTTKQVLFHQAKICRQQPQRHGLPHQAGSRRQGRHREADRELADGLAPRDLLRRSEAAGHRALRPAEAGADRGGVAGAASLQHLFGLLDVVCDNRQLDQVVRQAHDIGCLQIDVGLGELGCDGSQFARTVFQQYESPLHAPRS